MGSVLVVGSINGDLTLRVGRRPAPGETMIADDVIESCGGKGANQAVAAARAGAAVSLVGAVGDDERGRAQLAALRAEGVDTSGVSVLAGVPTGLAVVTVTPEGENAIVVAAGANRHVTQVAGAADVVVGQTELGAAAVDAAALSPGRFVLNDGPVVDLATRTLARADPLVVNEHEAASLGSSDPVVLKQITSARSVVITLGSRGAAIAEDGPTSLPARHVAAVDTTGAGDAFVGSLAAALADGAELIEAARLAIEVAADAVTRPGAR